MVTRFKRIFFGSLKARCFGVAKTERELGFTMLSHDKTNHR